MKHSYNLLLPHHRPGLDEIGAIFLLQRHAAEWGITNSTPIEFMTRGDYENPRMEETSGALFLGCGRPSPMNWANEHYQDDKNTSCCKLVAKELGLDKQIYGPLVLEITREDRYGACIKQHLAQFIKDRFELGETFEDIYPWVKLALAALSDRGWQPAKFSMDLPSCHKAITAKWGKDTADRWVQVALVVEETMRKKYKEACAFLKKNQEDFTYVDTYRGRVRAYIPSEVQTNPRITQAARSVGADIVLMQGALDFGEVGILIQTSQKAELCLTKVLEELRKHELLYRGQLDEGLVEKCKGEGTTKVCPFWHGFQNGEGEVRCTQIFSGAKSRPRNEKSILKIGYVVDLTLATLKEIPDGVIIKSVKRKGGNPNLKGVVDFSVNKFLTGGSDLSRVFEEQKQVADAS